MMPWNKGKVYRLSERQQGQGGHSIGEIFGPGVLHEYAGRNSHGHHLWHWRCLICDKKNGPSTPSHLRRSKCCFSCSRERDNNPCWKGYRDLTGVYLMQIKSDAYKRGLLFEMTPEYLWHIWEEQEGRCAYTRLPLEHGVDASLDRRDNAYGYVQGNVQWVHRDINRMKSDLRENHFISLCQLVARQLDCVGFDTAVPQLVSDFIRE